MCPSINQRGEKFRGATYTPGPGTVKRKTNGKFASSSSASERSTRPDWLCAEPFRTQCVRVWHRSQRPDILIEHRQSSRVLVVSRFKQLRRLLCADDSAGGQHLGRLAGSGEPPRDLGLDRVDQ